MHSVFYTNFEKLLYFVRNRGMIIMPNKLNNGTSVVFPGDTTPICVTSFNEFAKNANPIETGR